MKIVLNDYNEFLNVTVRNSVNEVEFSKLKLKMLFELTEFWSRARIRNPRRT